MKIFTLLLIFKAYRDQFNDSAFSPQRAVSMGLRVMVSSGASVILNGHNVALSAIRMKLPDRDIGRYLKVIELVTQPLG